MSKKNYRIICVAFIVCSAAVTQAQNFAVAASYQVGVNPDGIAAGDFNGDGKLDLIAVNDAALSGAPSVSLLLGNGDGTFQPAITIPTSGFPLKVAVGDFNGDGKLDFAVCYVSDSIEIYFGNGDGTFQPPVTVSVPALQPPGSITPGVITQLIAADLRGLGKPDLLGATGDGVVVLLNNGSGGFTPSGFALEGQSIDFFTVGDVNHDGKPDIVAAGQVGNISAGFSDQGFVALGNGDGTSQAPTPLPVTALTTAGLAL